MVHKMGLSIYSDIYRRFSIHSCDNLSLVILNVRFYIKIQFFSSLMPSLNYNSRHEMKRLVKNKFELCYVEV